MTKRQTETSDRRCHAVLSETAEQARSDLAAARRELAAYDDGNCTKAARRTIESAPEILWHQLEDCGYGRVKELLLGFRKSARIVSSTSTASAAMIVCR